MGCEQTATYLEVGRLKVNHRVTPLGIDDTTPRLSWIVESDSNGTVQNSYRILVSSTADKLHENEGDLWDSGIVASEKSTNIEYGGAELRSHQRCFWKVRVWDESGQKSEWSRPGKWSIGMLKAEDFIAEWIGYNEALNDTSIQPKPWANSVKRRDTYRPSPAPSLRYEFDLESSLSEATLYVSAMGIYEVYLNNNRLGLDRFGPGWTEYKMRIYYNTYDATDYLKEGRNSTHVRLADGWYAGNVANRGQHQYGDSLYLFWQLNLKYVDGTTEVVTSNAEWKASYGGHIEADFQAGETYDARHALYGLGELGYDDSAWNPVSLYSGNLPLIQSYPAERVSPGYRLRPQSIRKTAADTFIVDIGQNIAGWAALRFQGKPDHKVQMRFAEALNADSTLHTRNLRSARATDTYICASDEEVYWQPDFTYHGYRFIEVVGYPGELDAGAIEGVAVSSGLLPSGEFECDNELINKIYENLKWSQRGNFVDIPTDCPQRDERMGWTGDAVAYLPTSLYNSGAAAFYEKWMVDIVDGQFDDGRFPSTAPRIYNRVATAWGDAGVLIPWHLYRFYGDTTAMARHYEPMCRWVDFLESKSPNGICTQGSYGDWQNAASETPIELFSTAFYANSARLLGNMAEILGKNADADRFHAMFEKAREAFQRAYLLDDGKLREETQGGYVLGLAFDLIPEMVAAKSAARLRHMIVEAGNKLNTGFICTAFLFEVLQKYGYEHEAMKVLTARDFPSWGFQIENGATTPWERWDGYSAEKGYHKDITNSFNHYAFGSVGQWLYEGLAGIQILEPGFRQFSIDPMVGFGVNHVKASYRSIQGKIGVEWECVGDTIELELEIPVGSTAHVHIPTLNPETIVCNGESLPSTQILEEPSDQSERIKTLFGSGKYSITAVLPPRVSNSPGRTFRN